MSRSFLLLAVSGLALAACQPASEAPQDVSVETPPVVEEAVDTVDAEIEESHGCTIAIAALELIQVGLPRS